MSVLVKGWSIPPHGCLGCYFRTNMYCGLLTKNDRVWEYAERYERPSHCPLVEVPTPHGRLVDADRMLRDCKYPEVETYTRVALESAPTVIEAEE
jgi:hypothetical protein